MRESGTIISISGKYAVVRLMRKAACEHCNLCGFGKNDKHVDMKIFNDINAKIGDYVDIEFSPEDVAKAMSIIYIVPIFLAAIGLIIAMKLNLSELWQLVIAFSSLAVSVLLIYGYDKRFKKKHSEPKLIAVSMEDSHIE